MEAAMPIMALGGIVGAIGSIQQGNAAKEAAEYNAFLADRNAILVEKQTAEEERRLRVQSRKELGGMRAGYGASGVTSEASVADIMEESAATAELDALTLRYGGQMQAQAYRETAGIERRAGANAQKAGYMNAASSLLLSGGRALSYTPTSTPQVGKKASSGSFGNAYSTPRGSTQRISRTA